MPKFYDNVGNAYTVADKDKLGEGGQARAYKFKHGVAKLYKGPNDASLAGDTSQDARNRAGAKQNLATFHTKIEDYPQGLPSGIIAPKPLNGSPVLTNKVGKPLGYVMDSVPNPTVLKRFSEADFRKSGGITTEDILTMFAKVHSLTKALHKRGIVIGDNNDLNCLVDDQFTPYLIDTDSFQFAKYVCYSFTQRFTDPLLCDPAKSRLLLVKKHNEGSDWYAFTLQLIQSLLYVSPYDGVYKPKDKTKKVVHDARPLHRITVFSPEVKYPKFARTLIDPDTLPADMMQEFIKILHNDKRGEFPIGLLDQSLRSRAVAPAAIKSVTQVHGTVTSERIFQTAGTILCAAFQGGIKYIYHENDVIKREDGKKVLNGRLDPQIRYRICGPKTCLAKGSMLATVPDNDKIIIDTFGVLPMFDANGKSRFWLSNGRLLADDKAGATRTIGTVVQNQTLFWAGEKLGFGFYSAGELQEFFVFNTSGGFLKDGIKVPRIRGHLYDTTCAFSSDRIWFFATYQDGADTVNRCSIISKNGTILGYAEAVKGDGSWLGTIRGKCAIGNILFTATDEGITRIQLDGTDLVAKEFPDTEPFVDSTSLLFPGQGGLHVVNRHEVRTIRMS